MEFAIGGNTRTRYDKDKIKFALTIDNIYDLVMSLGGDPQTRGDILVASTICHNHPGDGSHKLYYYDNTHLFHCYTSCGDYFDIFELVMRVKQLEGHNDWDLVNSLFYVANFFSIEGESEIVSAINDVVEDMKLFEKYERIAATAHKELATARDIKVYSDSILTHLPAPIIAPWEREGITHEVTKTYGIRYNPENHSVVIPHYNVDGDLIGIRERTLVKENEIYGKYKPIRFGNTMYNHPVGFNLYNINNSHKNITAFEKAIVFEGEKSPLLYASYFGMENDISCSCSGSNISKMQIELLISLGAKEIIVGMDRQFKEHNDEEWQRLTKTLTAIHNKYGQDVTISFLFDNDNLLNYKDSPIDQGKEVFLKLLENRITL